MPTRPRAMNAGRCWRLELGLWLQSRLQSSPCASCREMLKVVPVPARRRLPGCGARRRNGAAAGTVSFRPFAGVRMPSRSESCANRGRRCMWPALDGAVFASLRLPCAARLEGVPQNSLRSLRSLRSDSCGKSVHEARCARPPQVCAAQRPMTAPATRTACRSGTGCGVRAENRPRWMQRDVRAGAAACFEAPRSAGFMAARVLARFVI